MDFEGPAQSFVDEIIICENVHKWFGEFEALRGIDIRVKPGEVIVIIGPSGSGKSTWIRCINRLEEHQEGRIIVDGIELTHDLRNIQDIRQEVGMVFQQFNLFPHLTVLDNITLAPINVRKWTRDHAVEVAEIAFHIDANFMFSVTFFDFKQISVQDLPAMVYHQHPVT